MSEDGWQAFLAAEGLEDWAVLHGGAATVYPVTSLGEAAALAAAIAAVPGLPGSGATITLRDDRVSVRLTRDGRGLEPHHIDLARAVSAAARKAGVNADRSRIQEVQFAVAAKPDDINLPFWRAVLGYDPVAERSSADPLGNSSVVWMQPIDADKPLRHAMHIDVSLPREHAEARVAAAVAAGGVIVVDDSPGTWILADAAGNKVCICAWPDGALA